jgi:hypothetical protein
MGLDEANLTLTEDIFLNEMKLVSRIPEWKAEVLTDFWREIMRLRNPKSA